MTIIAELKSLMRLTTIWQRRIFEFLATLLEREVITCKSCCLQENYTAKDRGALVRPNPYYTEDHSLRRHPHRRRQSNIAKYSHQLSSQNGERKHREETGMS
ncbi:hypothetical protein PYW08_008592 [Mythimna loreyi]|uniref:Uncharacterized protein n=1 Tax=Mythimna loreyi TaxID=667449 RepID=A0ACC2QCV5_9NEOP|nr:hypothetical protein PYW08_008592 [Mythimna loreyi]